MIVFTCIGILVTAIFAALLAYLLAACTADAVRRRLWLPLRHGRRLDLEPASLAEQVPPGGDDGEDDGVLRYQGDGRIAHVLSPLSSPCTLHVVRTPASVHVAGRVE